MSCSETPDAAKAAASDILQMDWKEQYRVSGIVALGGCLEFYDFAIFLFFTDVIGQQFFPVGMPSWLMTVQTWGLFAAGYLFRPLGGIVLAHFGDLFGRQRVFAFSILLMAASTLGIGLLPTYQAVGIIAPFALLFFRILQGIAIGGELPGAWTFVTEHVPPRRVGLVCGIVCGGLTLGILLATSVAAGVTSTFSLDDTQQWGWRLPFLLGGVFGLAGMKLRRMLNETPVFTNLRRRRMLVPELPLRVVLRTEGRGVVRSVFVTWILSSVVVLTIMLPMTLHGTYGIDKESALCAASISTAFLALGVVIGGALLDLIGAAKFYLIFAVLLIGAAFCYYNMAGATVTELNVLAGIVGLTGGVCAGTPYVMVSSFPARVRYTGVSFAYNVSYALFGGVIPLIINSLSPMGPLAHVLYFSVIALFAFGLGVSLLLRGAQLRPVD
jgi:nitrate/nitrite transporter NarK